MIKQMVSSSPFKFFVLTISISFLLGLCQFKIKRYLPRHGRFWNLKLTSIWTQIENILIIILCIASIGFIDVDVSLFELTILQTMIILIICKDYAFDLGKCFILSKDFSWPILIFSRRMAKIDIIHHLVGLIGCGYLIWTCCGGSVIVRLLLDILTNFIPYIRENYPQWIYGPMFYQRLCDYFFWIICIIIRFIYYPFVLVESVLIISKSMSMTDQKIHHYILFIFFTCWLVFSTIYHIAWMREVYSNNNDDDDDIWRSK